MLIHYTNVLATNKVHLDKSFVLAYIWRGLYFMLFSTGYYLFRLYKAGRDENELLKQTHYTYQLNKIAMEKRLAQSKTAFLLTQINPHFLFNTLNFIYYTTVKTSPEGANSIMLLSRIMRYSANIENAGSFVPLNQEIEYVRWLMEIHQIRLKDNFFVSFSYSAETTGWKIIPFLLVTVAENMFKHGEISDGLQTAKLDVFLDEEKNLIITSFNKKKRLSDSSGLKSGLINLQERMIHYYDDQALLEYHHHEDGYFRLRIFVPHLFKDIDQSPERSLQQKS
jgi:LytS/YehU family sensor histidine kinase